MRACPNLTTCLTLVLVGCLGPRCNPGVCGDSKWDPLEDCDPGHPVHGAYCAETCTWLACGDGEVSNDEACDPRADPEGCNDDCTLRTQGCDSGWAEPRETCFDRTTQVDLAGRPVAMAADDFDGDGQIDVVVATEDPAELHFLTGPGLDPLLDPLSFEPMGPVPAPAGIVALESYYGDVLALDDAGTVSLFAGSDAYLDPVSTNLAEALTSLDVLLAGGDAFIDEGWLTTDGEDALLLRDGGSVVEVAPSFLGDPDGLLPGGAAHVRAWTPTSTSDEDATLALAVICHPQEQRLSVAWQGTEGNLLLVPDEVGTVALDVAPLESWSLEDGGSQSDGVLIRTANGLAVLQAAPSPGAADTDTAIPLADTADVAAVAVVQVDAAGAGTVDPGLHPEVVWTTPDGLTIAWDRGPQGLIELLGEDRTDIALPGAEALLPADLDGNGWADFVVARPADRAVTVVFNDP